MPIKKIVVVFSQQWNSVAFFLTLLQSFGPMFRKLAFYLIFLKRLAAHELRSKKYKAFAVMLSCVKCNVNKKFPNGVVLFQQWISVAFFWKTVAIFLGNFLKVSLWPAETWIDWTINSFAQKKFRWLFSCGDSSRHGKCCSCSCCCCGGDHLGSAFLATVQSEGVHQEAIFCQKKVIIQCQKLTPQLSERIPFLFSSRVYFTWSKWCSLEQS